MPRFGIALVLSVCSVGCASRDAQRTTSGTAPTSVAQALQQLSVDRAPPRFARVDDRLYRGGQPTADQLRLLHALGVTKIVDLRRERLDLRREERATARELGMQFVELPFFGLFGADPQFLDHVIDELRADDGGAVYVHCDNGRDRTSLVVALYRVVVQGWSPNQAWKKEALDFGHVPKLVNREISLTFHEYALEHTVRVGTLAAAPAREREMAALVDGRGDAQAEPGDRGGELVDADSGALPTGAVVDGDPQPGAGDPVDAIEGLFQAPTAVVD